MNAEINAEMITATADCVDGADGLDNNFVKAS